MSWNLKSMTLFRTNSNKNTMKSHNLDIIPYKFYQKCQEIPNSRHYSIQILPKMSWNIMKSHNYDVIPYKFNQKMSWNLKIIILFNTNSTKNVMKCNEISNLWCYSIQILSKTSCILKSITLFHTKSTKNVMIFQNHDIIPYKFYQNITKSHNHDIIPYKFYKKSHEISKSCHYAVQILPKTSWNVMKTHKYDIIPYKFFENVIKSLNHEVITCKFYQNRHEILK